MQRQINVTASNPVSTTAVERKKKKDHKVAAGYAVSVV